MQIDEKLISYLEDLSFLTLSAEEKSRLIGDFQKILDSMEKLGRLNTDGVSGRSHPFDNVNVFREDQLLPSLDRELVLKNAAERNDEMIIAPRTVE